MTGSVVGRRCPLVPDTSIHELIPVSVEAPKDARRLVATISELEEYSDLLFTAQLLASELASNSVRHGGLRADESFSLFAHCDAGTLRVEVVDGGPGFDALHLLARHGRRNERFHGIFLVNALADRWGFRSEIGSCSVWFEIDLIPGRRPWRGREIVRV